VWTPRLPDLQWRAIFATHARRIQLLGDANLLPDDWRKWAEKYVEGKHGVWGVEICNDCGTQTVRECAHISMRWRADDSLLICDNCGIDGT
jgi:hypothetical protein